MTTLTYILAALTPVLAACLLMERVNHLITKNKLESERRAYDDLCFEMECLKKECE